jgi:hypothetical protein
LVCQQRVDNTYYTEGTQSIKLIPYDADSCKFYQVAQFFGGLDTNYTLSFDVKSDVNRELKFQIVTHNAPYVWLVNHDKIAVGKAWTTYSYTFHTQTKADSTYRFYFQLKNQTDPVWIDNVKLQKGVGWQGYSQEYENGWIGVNVIGSARDFIVPDYFRDWSKIDGNDADSHNNGTAVSSGDTLSIGAMDAYFLVKNAPDPQPNPQGRVSRPTGGEPASFRVNYNTFFLGTGRVSRD